LAYARRIHPDERYGKRVYQLVILYSHPDEVAGGIPAQDTGSAGAPVAFQNLDTSPDNRQSDRIISRLPIV